MNLIEIQTLTSDNFHPYGWVLGKATLPGVDALAFSNTDTDFREEHIFEPGDGGEVQILWVTYRNQRLESLGLEVHRLCQQAVIPLTGEIIQLVATSQKDGSPDTSTLKAFRIPVGKGICMKPDCWHATRVDGEQVHCMMLTRRSTTVDLVAHLTGGSTLLESSIAIA